MSKLGIVAATLLAASVSAAFAGPPPQTNTFTVDCNRHQTISDAIARGDLHKPLVVNIRGTCNEFVTIKRENVTLHGDPSAAINAPNSDSDLIYIGANGVTLENLTLTGGLMGIRVDGAFRTIVGSCVIQDSRMDGVRVFVGDVRITNSIMQRAGANGVYVVRGGSAALSTSSQVIDNANSGIYVNLNSTVTVNGSTISGNSSQGVQLDGGSHGSFSNTQIVDNGVSGIYAIGNSSVTTSGSTMSRNLTGVLLGSGAQGSFSASTITENRGVGITAATAQANIGGGNVISSNQQWGIWIYSGANATIYGNTIADNGWDGISGDVGTTLVLDQNQIRRNGAFGVACRTNCTMEIKGDTLEDNAAGGVLMLRASKLTFSTATTHFSGGGWGVQCGDKESSVVALEVIFDGTVSPTCTDFDN